MTLIEKKCQYKLDSTDKTKNKRERSFHTSEMLAILLVFPEKEFPAK